MWFCWLDCFLNGTMLFYRIRAGSQCQLLARDNITLAYLFFQIVQLPVHLRSDSYQFTEQVIPLHFL
ncbi:hypothetical protein HmCmsJML031_01604 [Escherichia coli]|nr:hypothetical protein HmCmsJML031_01604 [Escherichia coli]